MIRYLVFMLFVINLTIGVESSSQHHQKSAGLTAKQAAEKISIYLYENFDGQYLDKCCDHPGMTLTYDILVKCGKYLFEYKETAKDSLGNGHLCATQCVLESYGGFENGNFTSAEFIGDFFKRDKDFLGIYRKYYGFCAKRAVEAMKYIPSAQVLKQEKKCSPAPTILLLCLRSRGFLHCPANVWASTDKQCPAIKKNLIEFERAMGIM